MFLRVRLAIIVCILIALPACGAPPPPDLKPDEVISRAAAAMLAQNSMHFKIEIGGAPVSINKPLGLSLRSAEGDFTRPDRMGAHVKIVGPVAAIEADMIALGNDQYVTNFLTQKWEPLPAEFGFNPAVMFDPNFGLEKTLQAGLDSPTNVGVESIDGAQAYHVKGSLDGKRLQFMSGGLISTGRVEVDVWADAQAFTVRRAVLVDTSTDPQKPSTWTITFGQFGQPVSIEAPIR